MNRYLKILVFGFITWLVPFLASLLFYTQQGNLIIDVFLFKAIMIIVGSITAGIILIYYFKNINTGYIKEGIIIGISWFAINIILDLLVLIPMSGMSLADYFTRIGLTYVVIPVMCITVGTVLENKK
jgi:hypothetical protein